MLRGPLHACLLLSVLLPAVAEAPEPATTSLYLGTRYPLEVSLSFHSALLHWMDSLAGLRGHGMTAGKTIEAHREQYQQTLGAPRPDDVAMLERFSRVRVAAAGRNLGIDRHAITRAFFGTPDLDAALGAAASLLQDDERAEFNESVRYFATLYSPVWHGRNSAGTFLARARDDKARDGLGRFLQSVARFYDVPVGEGEPPRLILAPVMPGHGTHAQAVDRFLLIEVRPSENLRDQVAPIVHENAHFLFRRMGAERRGALERAAAAASPDGDEAWQVLHEALPTALGQGLAGQRFRRSTWTIAATWYDRPEVDAYAKTIFPLVRKALRRGKNLDETLLAELIRAFPAKDPGDSVSFRHLVRPEWRTLYSRQRLGSSPGGSAP